MHASKPARSPSTSHEYPGKALPTGWKSSCAGQVLAWCVRRFSHQPLTEAGFSSQPRWPVGFLSRWRCRDQWCTAKPRTPMCTSEGMPLRKTIEREVRQFISVAHAPESCRSPKRMRLVVRSGRSSTRFAHLGPSERRMRI